jgi:hypothetical protein
MEIHTNHFVRLEHGNDICGDGRTFIRSADGFWYETNGWLGDRYDRVEDSATILKLEAAFWKTMYENK